LWQDKHTPHAFDVIAHIFGQRAVKRPVMPDGLKLFVFTGDDLIQIHRQIRDRTDLILSCLGHQRPFSFMIST